MLEQTVLGLGILKIRNFIGKFYNQIKLKNNEGFKKRRH